MPAVVIENCISEALSIIASASPERIYNRHLWVKLSFGYDFGTMMIPTTQINYNSGSKSAGKEV